MMMMRMSARSSGAMDRGMKSYAMERGMHVRGADSEMGESGSGRSEVAMAINASEDRERLLTLARGVKNIMGVARDRR